MITNIQGKLEIKVLNKATLPEYWGEYFTYEKDEDLYNLTKKEFLKEIESIKKTEQPFIDSQVIISNILNKLGAKHNFHRQFSEKFPDLHRERVLGMQLYKIMIDEPDTWIYIDTRKSGHFLPHATYLMKM